MGSGATGKLGHAWVGAWVPGGLSCGDVMLMMWWGGKIACVYYQDWWVGIGPWRSLDGDDEEVIGVVSGCEII